MVTTLETCPREVLSTRPPGRLDGVFSHGWARVEDHLLRLHMSPWLLVGTEYNAGATNSGLKFQAKGLLLTSPGEDPRTILTWGLLH